MEALINALKRCVDEDGFFELDREQTIFFFFFLYELLERERGGEMRDGASVKFAIEDLLGSLPESVEDVGA